MVQQLCSRFEAPVLAWFDAYASQAEPSAMGAERPAVLLSVVHVCRAAETG